MTPICTYENHNLGDQLIFLHLLRALAKANPDRTFWHFTHASHCEQLAAVVEDLRNIELFSFESEQWRENERIAMNVWKNHADIWVDSPYRWDWSKFALRHHRIIAGRLGLRSPFIIREHLLFDYPALNPNNVGGTYFYDFLVINSEPCSGQFGPMKEHNTGYLNQLIQKLAKNHTVLTTNPVFGVECTRDTKKSITDIGRMSLMCRHHLCVATGPFWSTMNTTNHHHSAGRKRLVLLDNGEQLNMPGITQISRVEEAEDILRGANLI